MHSFSVRTGSLLLATAVVAISAVGGAARAAASAPASAVIQEVTTFGGLHEPPSGTFIATGLDGCMAGSFSDQVVSFSPSGARVLLDRTYSCDDGASLTARVALHLGTTDAAGNQTANGSWRIVSATGALADVTGSGSESGGNSGCTPVGAVFGTCATGTGTTIASIH